jgi:alanine-glyoxylate transaminase / serine-glyoxylate transaminase / serine-pyruvate transaminase
MVENGHFAALWQDLARRLGLEVELITGDWRRGVDAAAIESRLAEDRGHAIKAVCVVHNETSTGVTSDIPAVRRAIDDAHHPALLMVDTISSLASMPYAHDAWGVDVTVAGSQKGLMLPPGLSFNAVSEKARKAHAAARCPRGYWDWTPMLEANARGFFPYTPATNLLYGLDQALDMLMAEGLETVFARHARHAAATRAAVEAWGLEIFARNPAERSTSLTAVLMPENADADAVRATALQRFDLSLGAGLARLAGRVFRIGHLGDLNDLTLIGTLAGCEMALALTGPKPRASGTAAAMELLTGSG